jgi:hypothetical protein
VVVRVNQTHAKTSTTPPFAELLPAAGPSVFTGGFRQKRGVLESFALKNRILLIFR